MSVEHLPFRDPSWPPWRVDVNDIGASVTQHQRGEQTGFVTHPGADPAVGARKDILPLYEDYPPHTLRAASATSSSFRRCSSQESGLPSAKMAKPHLGIVGGVELNVGHALSDQCLDLAANDPNDLRVQGCHTVRWPGLRSGGAVHVSYGLDHGPRGPEATRAGAAANVVRSVNLYHA
jgi:hypothetical protein